MAVVTLDDVAAAMREKFTASKGADVTITAAEWTAMAQALYIADKLEAFLAHPDDDALAASAASLIRRVRSGREAVTPYQAAQRAHADGAA